jgi:hypothetical protein
MDVDMNRENTLAQTVEIVVGKTRAGKPAYEEVRVQSRGGSEYKLLQSPGLALGLAAGDVFKVNPDKTFEVVERGGNVCIQIFHPSDVREIEGRASPAMQAIGGRLDGLAAKELVYTISASVGFTAIEAALDKILSEFPTAEWLYGNVYDPNDGVTPLNWWKPQA